MRVRLLVLAALIALMPATAPALSLQYDLNDGLGFLDFPTDGTLAPIDLGVHHGVQIRIAQNAAQGDAIQGYVLNLTGTLNLLYALQFTDLFDDDQDPGTPGIPVDVTCQVRPTADSNCGAAFLGPLPTDMRPLNDVSFGTVEIFDAPTSADIVAFLRLDLTADQFGITTMVFDPGSTIVLDDGSELSVAGLGFQVVPEPGTVMLLGAGLAGFAFNWRKST